MLLCATSPLFSVLFLFIIIISSSSIGLYTVVVYWQYEGTKHVCPSFLHYFFMWYTDKC